MPVGLWVFDRVSDILYSYADIKFCQLFIYKLPPVVSDDSVRNSVLAYYIFPNKLLDLLCFNGR